MQQSASTWRMGWSLHQYCENGCSTLLPFLHWLRCRFSIPWQREAVWDVCDEASGGLSKLSQYPPVVDDEDLKTLEKFVVMMYDRSSTTEGVDDVRLDMFARKQRPYEAIPPTRSVLKQHVKCAAYQAGCIWSQSTVRQPETPIAANWGWNKKGDLWQIVWTELPPIAESCQQLNKCGCMSECCSRCK